MSFFRRQLISQSQNATSSVAKIKMICVVEDSNMCTIGASGSTRQALGIAIDSIGYTTATITIKNIKTNNLIYSHKEYIDEGSNIVTHPLCFEIYDLFPNVNPTNIQGGSYNTYYIANDKDFVYGERNYYEVDIEFKLQPTAEIIEIKSQNFSTINPDDTSKNPTPYFYYQRQLYQVIYKTNNIDIWDDVWHPDAIKE